MLIATPVRARDEALKGSAQFLSVVSHGRGHPIRGQADPPRAQRHFDGYFTCRRHCCCQKEGSETSVRRRFMGSSRTSIACPSAPTWGCRTLTTMADRQVRCWKPSARLEWHPPNRLVVAAMAEATGVVAKTLNDARRIAEP